MSTKGIRQIPTNHNIIGTCGKCGGPIISPIYSTEVIDYSTTGTGIINKEPLEWCMDCGATPKKIIDPEFGPVREME